MKRLAVFLALVLFAGGARADEAIRVVGSSTVFPFSTVVAEQFGRTTDHATPIVESNGTGAGMSLFCDGVGSPDIANASRPMKASEKDKCASNGVTDLLAVKFGYDGIVLAHAMGGAGPHALTRTQIWQALALELPTAEGWVANPHRTWADLDPAFPATAIFVYGPPDTSGTRDSFVELVMESACEAYVTSNALPVTDLKKCKLIREDGAYASAGEQDNVIVNKLKGNAEAVGIFGYSFLEENAGALTGIVVDGADPTFENIASGAYPLSRPLLFYVKGENTGVTAGLNDFVSAFVSDTMIGMDGLLIDRGLIPLSDAERLALQTEVRSFIDAHAHGN